MPPVIIIETALILCQLHHVLNAEIYMLVLGWMRASCAGADSNCYLWAHRLI